MTTHYFNIYQGYYRQHIGGVCSSREEATRIAENSQQHSNQWRRIALIVVPLGGTNNIGLALGAGHERNTSQHNHVK